MTDLPLASIIGLRVVSRRGAQLANSPQDISPEVRLSNSACSTQPIGRCAL
jgi:hypothetical protein